MKTFIAFTVVTACFTLGSTASACGSLQGAWELDHAVYEDASGKVVDEIKDGSVKERWKPAQ